MVNSGSATEAAQAYEAVLTEARAAIDAQVGPGEWEIRPSSAGGAFCDDGTSSFAFTDTSTSRAFTVDDTDAILDTLRPVLAEADFDPLERWAGNDEGGQYRAVDPRDGTFMVTLNDHQVSMSVQTGCYAD